MKVYNKDKTQELTEYDLETGYLRDDKIYIRTEPAQDEVKEVSHEEILAEYPNGSKEVEIIIDVPYQPARPERDIYEDIQVFIPYTAEELAERVKQTRLAEIIPRRDELSKDIIQAAAGLVIPDIEVRKAEFRALHNEIRELTGKEPRNEEEIL